MERKSFVFYIEWREAMQGLPDKVRMEVYEAIIEYVASGTIPELKETAAACFGFIKNDIDRDVRKYEEVKGRRSEAGKKGMASRYGKSNIKEDNKGKEAPEIKENEKEKKEPPPSKTSPTYDQILDRFLKENQSHVDQLMISKKEYTTLGKKVLNDWELAGWQRSYIDAGSGEFEALKFIRWIKTQREIEKRNPNETDKSDKFQRRRGADTTARSPEDYTGSL